MVGWKEEEENPHPDTPGRTPAPAVSDPRTTLSELISDRGSGEGRGAPPDPGALNVAAKIRLGNRLIYIE